LPGERAVVGAPAAASDEEVVAALRAGDERTFRELFERSYPMMKRVARGYVSSDAVAEEIVQETWMAIVTGIERFEGRSALGTWMFSILTNQAKSHSARERRALPFSSVPHADVQEPAVDPDRFQKDDEAWPGHWATPPRPWQKPERRLLSLEAREQLKEALAQLPERQRLIVALRDIEGLSAEEVCDLLDLSHANQRVLLHRGRSRLRAFLEGYVDGRVTNRQAIRHSEVEDPGRRHDSPLPSDRVTADEVTCQQFVELVTDYFEGTLPPRTLSQAEEHLVMCDWCVTYVEQMQVTVESLRRLGASGR
jgi:RNA polymerase sigma-70 factor (ECF subfamily)